IPPVSPRPTGRGACIATPGSRARSPWLSRGRRTPTPGRRWGAAARGSRRRGGRRHRERGTALVLGGVRLVQKAGAELAPAVYGDRRLRDVERVDYQPPGFFVVFAGRPGSAAAGAPAGGGGSDPALAATDLAHGFVVTNASGEARIVSAPSAGFVQSLAPGASARIAPAEAGELELHVLGASV